MVARPPKWAPSGAVVTAEEVGEWSAVLPVGTRAFSGRMGDEEVVGEMECECECACGSPLVRVTDLMRGTGAKEDV
jgi:hypothetical protein